MEERAIDRLRKFARYARDKGVVKGENSFEAYCELSNRYIYNSIRNGKGAIGTDIIARIVDKFPELNVKWLCTGKGNMIETDMDANVNYKAAVRTALGNKKSSDLLKIRGFFILKIANNRYLFFPSYPHFT